jgi:hypothetical protein
VAMITYVNNISDIAHFRISYLRIGRNHYIQS